MERLMIIYNAQKRRVLKVNPFCARFPKLKSEDVHHTRGRVGSLLLDERFWRAVSRKGHDWIGNNMAEARKLGLLCEVGQWNVPVAP